MKQTLQKVEYYTSTVYLQKENITVLSQHLKNFIPLFLEVQKAEEKMETK